MFVLTRLSLDDDNASLLHRNLPWLNCRSGLNGSVGLGSRISSLGQTEVAHLYRAIRCDFDIPWFQIPMDDPLLTGCFEGFRDLFGDGQSLLDRHGTPAIRSASVDPSTSSMTMAWSSRS